MSDQKKTSKDSKDFFREMQEDIEKEFQEMESGKESISSPFRCSLNLPRMCGESRESLTKDLSSLKQEEK